MEGHDSQRGYAALADNRAVTGGERRLGAMIATLENNAEAVGCPLIEGATYRYKSRHPIGCFGHTYRLHREVVDVPSYQKKVLVEALSGPDRGLLFTCTLQNFALRYEMVGDQG